MQHQKNIKNTFLLILYQAVRFLLRFISFLNFFSVGGFFPNYGKKSSCNCYNQGCIDPKIYKQIINHYAEVAKSCITVKNPLRGLNYIFNYKKNFKQ